MRHDDPGWTPPNIDVPPSWADPREGLFSVEAPMTDDRPQLVSMTKVNAVLADLLTRGPQDDPLPLYDVIEEDGVRWRVTAEWRDGWLDWRIETGGLDEWGLGRRIIAGQSGKAGSVPSGRAFMDAYYTPELADPPLPPRA